ncbi:helix-turn-helix domain-containing protein [Salinicoccus carnicancri]|uniref:helix-turn-helix domain-containing protein n=1 Tax=Salinicoccus carnicancri TaxID=558170 RepID=UPI000308A231|nr:helix-turn-helix transcriptional regulator [Salinicoccus carnicancri]
MNGRYESLEDIVYRIIGKRIKYMRKKRGLTQSDLGSDELTFISKDVVSAIENGKLFKTRTTFITDNELSIISKVFNVKSGKIIFGESSEEIDKLVFKFYQYVAYSLITIPSEIYWNEYCNTDSNINDCSIALQSTLQFSALYTSFRLYIEHIFKSGKQKEHFTNKDIEKFQKKYDKLIYFFWTSHKDKIVQSFVDFWNGQKEINMKKFKNLLVEKWVNTDLRNLILNIKDFYKTVPYYGLGYEISEELYDHIEDILDYLKFNVDYDNNLLNIVRADWKGQEHISRHEERVQDNTVALYHRAMSQEMTLRVYS